MPSTHRNLGARQRLHYSHGVPIFYECQRCTACCRWPGQVRLTDAEISRLAAFKGMGEHDFIQQFTRLRSDRGGLVLPEKSDDSCVFLQGDDCSVQPVKPQQCRGFPNRWNFPGFEKTCRAIPRQMNDEDYLRRVAGTCSSRDRTHRLDTTYPRRDTSRPISVDAANLNIKTLLLIAMMTLARFVLPGATQGAVTKPNIIFILADDLGYGDVKCFNPEGKIPTPNLDRLASEGMSCTDAHSSSAVCTPTRYSIMTGRYNWRSPLKSGVLFGFSPRLIEAGRLTVAGFLRQQGYATACIGKWHLGMDWPLKNGGFAKDDNDRTNVDYSKPIQNGPNAIGFDYYFGISASLDMPPFVFIENDHVTEVPTVEKKWVRTGPAAESFDAENVLPTLTSKAVEFLAQHAAAAKRGKPFFLYLPLNSPHGPIVPTKDWRGKSGLNAYADYVMQTDASVGRVLAELDKQGIAENTLVIMTSDNGCSPVANIPELLAKGHNPSYHFRGYKADIFDGGHRIPLLMRWPHHIKAGTSSDQLVCLVDFFRTCADLLGVKLPDTAAEDSVSLLPALEGRARKPLHEAIVHHSINGSFSIRDGKWKLELCPDSGGWSDPRPGSAAAKGLPAVQLYDLSRDIGERENVEAKNPEVVHRLTGLLEKYVADGRSTPGKPQPNTGKVEIRRAEESPIQIELFDQFASFTNRKHPDNRIGYRFHEHTPLIYGDVPQRTAETNRKQNEADPKEFGARPGVKIFHRPVTEAGWVPQDWTFYLSPVADGIEMLFVVKTGDVGLPEFYGVQQCFRLTGTANAAWRQKYARTPAFSEFDLWRNSPAGAELVSLSGALLNGSVKSFPAGKETVGCRTTYGGEIDTQRSGGHLENLAQIGPYHARMLWTGGSGLIIRTSADRKWSTGLYWERTTHLSDHHPADCLHAIVNIGGIAPHSQRVLRGKIYWLAGPGETLLKHWRKDFPDAD